MRKAFFHWSLLAASCALVLGILMELSLTWDPAGQR